MTLPREFARRLAETPVEDRVGRLGLCGTAAGVLVVGFIVISSHVCASRASTRFEQRCAVLEIYLWSFVE